MAKAPPKNNCPDAGLDADHRKADLRRSLLAHLHVLRIPILPQEFDQAVSCAQRQGLDHLHFLDLILGRQADQRRQRSIAWRIRQARFRDPGTLESFDWQFNAKTIDRVRVQTLATCQFIRGKENLLFLGQSGLGKSHLVQAIGRQACVLGHAVRYTTSGALIDDLTASMADQSLPSRLRYYARFPFLIIDEFGFDRLERQMSPQAASLLYKVIDTRLHRHSTALVTNLELDAWERYIQDGPLAMAMLDRLVDGAHLLRFHGRSYRACRVRQAASSDDAGSTAT